MVNLPLEYEWSSYGNYLGVKKDKLVSEERILKYFKNRLDYQQYVEQDINPGG